MIEHWSITYADDTSQVANICNSIMLILTFLGAVLVSGVTYYDPEPDLTHDISFRLGFIVLCVGLAAMLVATISAIIAHHRRAWSHALLFILILFGCFFTAVFWSHFVFLFRLILYAVAGLLILVLIGHRDVLSWSNAPLDESGHKIPGEFDSNDPNVFNTNDGRRLVRNTNHGEWEED